ncbi:MULTISPECIES: restriction endonuclease subunit S [unclassified Bradyrhizobium]|uniref:restriction endonuclease subunit S n=1 Tax=unclassified Bradyrhizobium TaxID=2631580 RepID=UPI001FFAD0D1
MCPSRRSQRRATISPSTASRKWLTRRPSIGRQPVTFSNHFVRIRTKDNSVEPAYVARWLQREFEHRRFASMCRSWVNQASITKDQLASLSLPLPSLDEQRRIAAILDCAASASARSSCFKK